MTVTANDADTETVPGGPVGSRNLDTAMRDSVSTARSRTRRTTVVVLLSQVAVLAAFLGLWQWAADSGRLKSAPLFYGSPSGVYDMLTSNFGDLMSSLMATFRAAVTGFGLGVAAALVIGVILSQVPFLNRVANPYIVVLTGLPRIALAPIFVLWFGIGTTAKVALAFSLVFFIVLINVLAGFKSVNKDLVVMAQSFGASRLHVVMKVALPAAVPVLFAGLRLGLVFSILAVIASEMTAAHDGLGLDVVQYAQTMQPNGVFAVLVVLAAAMAPAQRGAQLR